MGDWEDPEIDGDYVRKREQEIESMPEDQKLELLAQAMDSLGLTPEDVAEYRKLKTAEYQATIDNMKQSGNPALSPYIRGGALEMYLKGLWFDRMKLEGEYERMAKEMTEDPEKFFNVSFSMGFDIGYQWAKRER